jgi:elongation factor P
LDRLDFRKQFLQEMFHSMLDYNEIVQRKYIIHNDEPYEVLTSHVFRKQMRKPVNATKLKNLITGRVVEVSFQATEKVDEADMKKSPVKYIYEAKGEYWFHPDGKPQERFTISTDTLGDHTRWLKPNSNYEAVVFTNDDDEERIIGLALPLKVDLKVTEAAPAVKGNTSQGATKTVVVETGTEVNVPLFINEGDIIRVNTETGDYAERVEKN